MREKRFRFMASQRSHRHWISSLPIGQCASHACMYTSFADLKLLHIQIHIQYFKHVHFGSYKLTHKLKIFHQLLVVTGTILRIWICFHHQIKCETYTAGIRWSQSLSPYVTWITQQCKFYTYLLMVPQPDSTNYDSKMKWHNGKCPMHMSLSSHAIIKIFSVNQTHQTFKELLDQGNE